MPIEAQRNYFVSGNLVIVRDTANHETFEVYLNLVPDVDGGDSILVHVEPLRATQLPGRVDPVLSLTSVTWRCWASQIPTPRFTALRGPMISSIGNISMLENSSALACDAVEAYRLYALRQEPEPESTLGVVIPSPVVARVSRYEREPVI